MISVMGLCNFCEAILQEKDLLIGARCCELCYAKFEFINTYKGRKCKNCQKKLRKNERAQQICNDCRYWKQHVKLPLVANRALFYYNEFSHEVIERAKFRGDVQLWESIAWMVGSAGLLPKYNVQCIPSSIQSYEKRDFNHLEYILEYQKRKALQLLQKKENIPSQITLNDVRERRILKDGFIVMDDVTTRNIVLFDDVYTTGSTLKDCQKILAEKKIRVAKTVTIFRSDLR